MPSIKAFYDSEDDGDTDSDSTQGPGQILVGLLIRYKGILGAALGALVGGSIVWFVLKRP